MRMARLVLALAGAALLLAACGGNREPHLMNLRNTTDGPDEFAIQPPKPLETPADLAALPEPTPGSGNLTDQHPMADAITALGGRVPVVAAGVPAVDGGLVGYAGRHGVVAGIRTTLASEDLRYRQTHPGKPLERLFNVNTYYKAYFRYWLDAYAELAKWRVAGVATPSAPPQKGAQQQ
ncbi:MAG: DUF3035 domain-containing protein [bacterium]